MAAGLSVHRRRIPGKGKTDAEKLGL